MDLKAAKIPVEKSSGFQIAQNCIKTNISNIFTFFLLFKTKNINSKNFKSEWNIV